MCHFNENQTIIEEQETMNSEPKVEERGLSLPDFEHLYHYALDKHKNAIGHELLVYKSMCSAYRNIIDNNLYFFWKSLTFIQQCDYFMCFIGAEYERGSNGDELDPLNPKTLYVTLQDVNNFEKFDSIIKRCFYNFFDIGFCTHGMMEYVYTRANCCLIKRLKKYAKNKQYKDCKILEQFVD